MSISITEQQLIPDVSAAQQGDISAFERLVSRCQCSVSTIALAIVKDVDASDDITQQVFIHIWQQLNTLQNPASFLPWVRQITRYRAFNYLRDNKISDRLSPDETDKVLAEFASDTELSDELEKAQQNRIMADFISQLPEDSREVVLLFYREEQNSQQVAELLGLSESNVRKKLQRVRELLKGQLLAKYGKLVLSTAPGLGLTTAICSALMVASPPATAALTVAVTQQSSWLSKVAVLLGGAMLGALAGIAGVVAGMRQPIKRASSIEQKQQLIRLRYRTIVWLLSCGVLLTVSYEFTAGAWGPISAFTLFVSGLLWANYRGWQLMLPQLKQQDAAAYRKNLLWCVFGLLLVYGMGFAGLIIGLSNSGRL